jgi:hypothetical protein
LSSEADPKILLGRNSILCEMERFFSHGELLDPRVGCAVCFCGTGSWLGPNNFHLYRNADELISQYLSLGKTGEGPSTPRKSVEAPEQPPKKRGHVRTKSQAGSGEEDQGWPPDQPTQRKPKAPAAVKSKTPTTTKRKTLPTLKKKAPAAVKSKTPTTTKRKTLPTLKKKAHIPIEKAPTSVMKKAPTPLKEKEIDHNEGNFDPGQHTPMDKYTHPDSWDELIDKIETVDKDEEGGLVFDGTLYGPPLYFDAIAH